MGVLNIRQAKRAGSKVVIGIAGQSGDGKTLTALYLARGIVNSASEIGFLDTENRRGSLYADKLDAPFLIGDLYPPFSPHRYSQAIKEFQDAGVKVLVIDSVTHEWEGEGGCEDIAASGSGKIANWKLAKAEHKKFMNTLLQSDMHIICCIRAREKTDFKNPKQPVSLGIQPICEKNFMFEMTASIMMHNRGKNQTFLKMPDDLFSAFGNGQGYVGSPAGKALIDWVNSGDQTDSDLEQYKAKMQMATSGGLELLQTEWKKMPKDVLGRMKPFYPAFEESAKAYDKQAEQAEISSHISFESEGGFDPSSASKPEQVKQEEAPSLESNDDPF
jgi:hypothetical protein